MRFVDEVELLFVAGRGGNGMVSFRRESHVPRGGPDGGNGGHGGNVYLQASSGMTTLLDLRSRKTYKAQNGQSGGSNRKAGKAGDDWVIQVPVGTLVYNTETGVLIADLTEDQQKVLIAEGGKGGRGNSTFKTSTRQAPRFASEGREGQEIRVQLSLKVMADVGLVGFPNAGKSTLITKISEARPRVAEYPFTTLTPNLGVVASGMLGSFVVADIPGLIEGAHEGAGLGHQFLKHIERTRVLVFLLSLEPGRVPVQDYHTLSQELALYAESLVERPRLIVASKMDLVGRTERDASLAALKELANEEKVPFVACSSFTGEGIQSFRRTLEAWVAKHTSSPELKPYDPLNP